MKLNKSLVILEENQKERMKSAHFKTKDKKLRYFGNEKVRL